MPCGSQICPCLFWGFTSSTILVVFFLLLELLHSTFNMWIHSIVGLLRTESCVCMIQCFCLVWSMFETKVMLLLLPKSDAVKTAKKTKKQQRIRVGRLRLS